jgi:hypothetical protein
VLAGHLHRSRPRTATLDHLTGYGMVHTGAITAITPTGDPVTLTPGATWDPRYRLNRATSSRTVLIAIENAAIERLRAAITDTSGQPAGSPRVAFRAGDLAEQVA